MFEIEAFFSPIWRLLLFILMMFLISLQTNNSTHSFVPFETYNNEYKNVTCRFERAPLSRANNQYLQFNTTLTNTFCLNLTVPNYIRSICLHYLLNISVHDTYDIRSHTKCSLKGLSVLLKTNITVFFSDSLKISTYTRWQIYSPYT